MVGIGIQCVLKTITDEELLLYDGIAKVEGDEREGQYLLIARFDMIMMGK